MITDQQIEKAIDWMRDNAEKLSQAKANRIYLEEFRKSKKAMLMKEAEIEGHKTSSAQEREAYANEEYVELLRGLKTAVEDEEKLKWMMTAAELKTEIWRTQSANARAEGRATS
jgi:hypothetical protein